MKAAELGFPRPGHGYFQKRNSGIDMTMTAEAKELLLRLRAEEAAQKGSVSRYTAAVDRGEEDLLGVYQRKAARKAERRARRAVAKEERKARNEVREDEEKTKRQALTASIKAMGQCCGVFRKPAPYGRAICLKCGQPIRIPKQAGVPSAPGASPALKRAPII